jgi:23S rRNA (cytosine1962-C5)-methyltransferase
VVLAALATLWDARRVLYRDSCILAVDKPSGIVVHGGREALGEDVVSRLVAAGLAGEQGYLGVHQRLDQGASGVMMFTTRRDQNAEVARAFRDHEIERSYVAAIGSAKLPREGRLQHRLSAVARGRVQVVTSGGRLALARFRTLRRRGERALVELCPETGRTHQLRVQLAASGAAIAGDTLYGGAPASRLLLHARSLALPSLGRTFTSRVPEEFERWLDGDEEALGSDLRPRLLDAGMLRAPFSKLTSAVRWVNGAVDQLPGVTVDAYDDWVVLGIASERAAERARELAELCLELGARGVYLKRRVRADLRRAEAAELAPDAPFAGVPAPRELWVSEHGLRFRVELDRGLSTGLFLDQRDGRRVVFERACGARVLNLFSYTCAFGVAAAAGGAVETTNVDLSARALEVGRENYRENGLDAPAHRFERAEAREWLRRAARRGERFDLIVFDPPSFGTAGRRVWSAAQDYGAAARAAFDLIAPGGRMLAVSNHRKTSLAR